jgi:hypothetical protein
MSAEEEVKRLLEKYKHLVGRLNRLNEEMNEVGTDEEDMRPGHDDGQEFFAKLDKYQATLDQARMVREELRKLGYKYAL